MSHYSSPWLDAAVVGAPDEFAGVCVRPLDLPNLRGCPTSFIRQLTNQLEGWCLLAPAAIPQKAADVVFKMSRHRVEGRTITWMGFYLFAKFPRNPRSNTYVGIGVLACDCSIPVAKTLRFLRESAHLMFDRGETVNRSAGEIAEALKLSAPALQSESFQSDGVRANAADKLYVDLSSFSGQELEAAVIRVLGAVESHKTFSTYYEILVGTTRELRESVAASHAYVMVDDSGQPLEERTVEAPAAPAPRYAGYDDTERRKKTPAFDALGAGRAAEGVFSTQTRFDDVERRLRRLEQQIFKRGLGSDPDETGDRGWMITAVVSIMMLIALVCILVVQWPDVGRFSAFDPALSASVEVSRASSVCVSPEPGDQSELGLQAARAEIECLESELNAKRELVKKLEKLQEDGD